jgi:4-hydroxy-2-oxoheptanedioate aldolase
MAPYQPVLMRGEVVPLRQRLLADETLVGCMISDPAPWLVEVAALAGFDYVTLDLEHEPISVDAAASFVRTCDAAGVASILRVPLDERIEPLLNSGASGVQVPQIASRAAALELQHKTRFHPLGRRGYTASTRSASFGLSSDARTYMRAANEDVLVIAMVEDIAGVDDLEAIAEVPGIDAFYVGPNDLAQSMGFPEPTVVQAVVDDIIVRLAAARRPVGLGFYVSSDPAALAFNRDRGVRLFTVVLNRILADHVRKVQASVRERLAGGPATP